MKTNKRELLCDIGLDDAIVFDNPDYDSAIVGVDICSDRVVYDYDLMIKHLIEFESMNEEEAIEFIEYNTVRACPYFGEKAPIILRNLEY